jgi:hypothetical protein
MTARRPCPRAPGPLEDYATPSIPCFIHWRNVITSVLILPACGFAHRRPAHARTAHNLRLDDLAVRRQPAFDNCPREPDFDQTHYW